ncbi:MAG TPA: 30S ribosomal protein S20 [Rhizomicrobium sp.]|jgi:small subunit ribosomal protein S20|nr:30S ribosomal protein S20 [Rhizomicrobium sp.]
MPNIDSAKKRARQTPKRTAVNHARKSRIRSYTRKAEEAIAAGDREAALMALKAAEPELMRGAAKGVLHRNTAQRKVSRLTKRAAKLAKK